VLGEAHEAPPGDAPRPANLSSLGTS